MPNPSDIEAAVCERLVGFARDYLGLGPRTIRASLLASLLVVRLEGMLTVAERQLLLMSGAGIARDTIKQMRVALVEAARPILVGLVEEITGRHVVAVHHDLSTVTGEEVFVFSFDEAPRQHT